MDEEPLVESTALPFFMSLRSPLTIGSAVLVKGYVLENAVTFSINFCTPLTCCFYRLNGKDTAFSLRPYFDQRYIVRNSSRRLKWREEETAGNQNFPLSRACNFLIEIFIAGRDLFIAINGIHFCTFTLHATLSSINCIEIDGDIILESVTVNTDQDIYPKITASQTLSCSSAGHIVNFSSDKINCKDLVGIRMILTDYQLLGFNIVSNLQKLPLLCVFTKTLESGCTIKIKGKAKMLPYSFLINLQDSELKWPHPSILLHINARYSYSQKKSQKNLLVLNSWLDNSWGIEKTCNSCLPMPGTEFEIIITCKEDCFRVQMLDEIIIDFPYRSSVKNVKVMYIQGDICIYSVTFS